MMNFQAGFLQSVACQLHPGQNILQGCTDVECRTYPFLCRVCLQDQNQLQQHQSHGSAIKSYDEFLHALSRLLSDQQTSIVTNYKDIFLKPENANILKWLSESEGHLSSLERFIASQKHIIEADFKQILEEIQFTLKTTQQHMFDRLDEFYKSYESNLNSLKDIAEPLNLILTKFKYYSNVNNLRSKVGCDSHRSAQVTKIKNCLCVGRFLDQVDKTQQVDTISRAFLEINKALDTLPQYRNETLNKSFEEATKILQSFFTTNLIVPDIQLIGPFIPVKLLQTPKKEELPMDQASKITFMLDDISVVEQKDPVKTDMDMLDDSMEEQIIVYDPPPMNIFQSPLAVHITDSRSCEHIIINQLISKHPQPQNKKFKIKKKLTLDIHISAICLISPNLLGIGGKEGSIKLLDLTTNKVSFYPNAFITHFDEVVCLTSLKQARTNSMMNKMISGSVQDRGNRLASASLDTNIIIWTLGENNIPYPERKLVGFDKHIVRMVDLEDGSYFIAANHQGDIHVVNYHDNRVPFTFKAKMPTTVIELLYLCKLERFIVISATNQIQVYQLGFKQMQIQTQAQKQSDDNHNTSLLMSCELEQTIQGPNVGTITTCLAVELNDNFTICYGNNQGVIACYDYKRNQMIANIQLFTTQILELASFKTVVDVKLKKYGFLLTVLAEGELNIKAVLITQEEKITKMEQFGELLEKCLGSSSKYIIQNIQKSGTEGRAAIVTLNANQRDISIMELM